MEQVLILYCPVLLSIQVRRKSVRIVVHHSAQAVFTTAVIFPSSPTENNRVDHPAFYANLDLTAIHSHSLADSPPI